MLELGDVNSFSPSTSDPRLRTRVIVNLNLLQGRKLEGVQNGNGLVWGVRVLEVLSGWVESCFTRVAR
jgi:hypothetical protein